MKEVKINQILKNQATILYALSDDFNNEIQEAISRRMSETEGLLNPREQPTLPQKTKLPLQDDVKRDNEE